jgi:TRAP-type C4-dicarboxylate transport system substrate-binding protein
MVIVNGRSFKRLSPELQKAVMEAAATAETRGWEMAESETASKTATLAEHGIKVAKPSEQLTADLRAIGKIMGDEWAQEAGAAGKEIMSAYK